VAEHRRTLRVNHVLQDARYIEGSPNTRSEMAIPLLFRSELLGVLNVESEQVSAYAENDEELLGTLGGSLAAIIANARLMEQIRSQAERERILFDISDKIRRTTDMETILATTASELTRAVGATGARIRLGVSTTDAARKGRQTDE
jgi:sigma-B regulation protein RsbU (phosphoserine phosphatase)